MGPTWAKKWAKRTEEFTDHRDQAKKEVLKAFDTAIKRVNKVPDLTPEARSDRRQQLKDARADFERKGTFPADDQFIVIELEYLKMINQGALPLSQMIGEVIEKAGKTNDGGLEKRGLKMKAELEKQLGGASRLVESSVWEGQLHRADGTTVPYSLEVGKMGKGGLFNGHVEDNPGVAGNWRYDVEGQTRALGVQFKMSKSLRGNFVSVTGDGIVSGDRLIANLVLVEGNGKTVLGRVVLKKRVK